MPKDWLPVPHYKRTADGQCLPACAHMVLAHYLSGWYTASDISPTNCGISGWPSICRMV